MFSTGASSKTRRVVAAAFVGVIMTVGPCCPGGLKAEQASTPIKAGMIGLDTSHVIAFTKFMNDPEATDARADVKIVAGYPAGSPDMPRSANRIKGYTDKLRDEMGVEIVGSIDELLEKVDVVMLMSVDGRPHLEQVKPVFRAGKPVFVDKPCAASLADVLEIYRLAEQYGVPCFSASCRRFTPGVREMFSPEKVGNVLGCDAYSQAYGARHHTVLNFTGVHGVEMLYTIMGRGCASVTHVETKYTEQVTGVWADGRVGTWRGIRSGTGGKGGYGATVFGSKAIADTGRLPFYISYEPLTVEIAKFFKTGKPPVRAEDTIEIYAYLEAAEESKRRGGKPVTIAEVLEKARNAVRQTESRSSTKGLSEREIKEGVVGLLRCVGRRVRCGYNHTDWPF